VLAEGGKEEQPAARPHLLKLVRVGVERPQQAGGQRDGLGAVGEEGRVPVGVVFGGFWKWVRSGSIDRSSDQSINRWRGSACGSHMHTSTHTPHPQIQTPNRDTTHIQAQNSPPPPPQTTQTQTQKKRSTNPPPQITNIDTKQGTYRRASVCASRTHAGRLQAVKGSKGKAHSLTAAAIDMVVVVEEEEEEEERGPGGCMRAMAYRCVYVRLRACVCVSVERNGRDFYISTLSIVASSR
jgi:hypothetical protein